MNAEILFSGNPVLETPRFQLRKLSVSDAEDFFEFASDDALTEHVAWEVHRSLEDTRTFLSAVEQRCESRISYNWAIVERASGKVIGRVSMFEVDEDNDIAEIGYAVGRAHWGQGVATEAGKELIKFGFEDMGLNRIEARCNSENFPSEKVMQRLGMTFEGIIREELKIRNEYKSQKLYSILRSEYLASRS